jgi:riboflavin biosynthesis pyrimidine reductase
MIDALRPLESLYEMEYGTDVPLPPKLATLYGRLPFPSHMERPYIVGNFAQTLDGVVALNTPGEVPGGTITGFSQVDHMLMGLLRAVADTVIVGAGTLRAVPHHIWTARRIYPPLADAYRQLRVTLGKVEPPLNVFVTARGELDLGLPVFRSSVVPSMVITTHEGLRRLQAQKQASSVQIVAVDGAGPISTRAILDGVAQKHQSAMILIEGGPHLMGSFIAERYLDELFLSLAPQVAGRDATAERPGFVAGQLLAPQCPTWGTLVSVKRSTNHLFLRYAFERGLVC